MALEMTKIAIEHRKPYSAKYNPLVSKCPECWTELMHKESYGTVFKHIYGFADTNIGNLAMVECPKCFHKWSFHSRLREDRNTYHYFLDYIKDNKHFNQLKSIK